MVFYSSFVQQLLTAVPHSSCPQWLHGVARAISLLVLLVCVPNVT